MKKILMSAVALTAIMGTVNTVSAADEGIDIKTTGQAVIYYNSASNTGFSHIVDAAGARANYGIQLNLDADLKNNFTFGSQINYLGTLGLEKNVVGSTMQNTNGGTAENSIADDIYLSKLYIAKQIANTTIKLGRQELPKSLSPFAFSEGWNVFKNTFDAALVVNSDIPDTLVVGAYVGKGNGNGFGHNMSSFTDLSVVTGAGTTSVAGTAYMLTIQNKSIPMTAITASYYDLAKVDGGTPDLVPGSDIGATAIWLDAKIADKSLPMGLKVGLQGGQIAPESTLGAAKMANTTAFGLKVGAAPMKNLNLCLAYTSVDGDDNKVNVAMKNTTGVKTPLYTQMIANQNAIALDANTVMLKAAYKVDDFGTFIVQGTSTTAGQSNLNGKKDNTDAEFIFKTKVGGVNLLAAYLNVKTQDANTLHIARVVARYNF